MQWIGHLGVCGSWYSHESRRERVHKRERASLAVVAIGVPGGQGERVHAVKRASSPIVAIGVRGRPGGKGPCNGGGELGRRAGTCCEEGREELQGG
eukprot:364550-Chlamydomonas_euryale.AAC.8